MRISLYMRYKCMYVCIANIKRLLFLKFDL